MFPITIDRSVSARVAIALPTVIATDVAFCRRVVSGQSLLSNLQFPCFPDLFLRLPRWAGSLIPQGDSKMLPRGRSVQTEADMLSDTARSDTARLSPSADADEILQPRAGIARKPAGCVTTQPK